MPRSYQPFIQNAQAADHSPNNQMSFDPSNILELGQGALDLPDNILQYFVEFIENFVKLLFEIPDALLTLLQGVFNQLSAGFGGIAQDILNVLIGFLTGVGNVGGAVVDDLLGALENIPLIGPLIEAITGVSNPHGGIADLATAILGIARTVETVIAQALTGILGIILNPIGTIESWIADILGLLGNPSGLGTGVGTSAGGGTTSAGQTLNTLLGMLDSTTPVPAELLKALAVGTTTNILKDPSFATNSYIQGQLDWCWDGLLGSNGTPGSVRTVRRGLIAVYIATGTPGAVLSSTYGVNTVQEWLQNPDTSYLAAEYMFTGLDATYFEPIYVPQYSGVTVAQGVAQSITWLTNTINSIPGPFILVGLGQGTLVMSGLYDQIRYGSMQARRNDLLAGLMFGNLRREEGRGFPGFTPPANTSGCVTQCATVGPYAGQGDPTNPAAGNLIDTEDLWWEMCAPGDYLTECPVTGTVIGGAIPSWYTDPTPNQPMSSAYTSVIDELVLEAMAAEPQAPGMVVGIQGPMGYYYQSYGTGLTVNDHFQIGSVTKGFTATAILKAVGDGLLTLDDTLDMYIDGLQYGDQITIRQCLMQTSGVFDTEQNETATLQYLIFPNTYFSPSNLLDVVIEGGAPNFKPGLAWMYTESNFILLGFVLESIYSGEDPQVTITNNVINAAGLTETGWVTTTAGVGNSPPAPAATGHILMLLDYLGLSSGTQVQSGANLSYYWTAGAMYSTIQDLTTFGQVIGTGSLLDPAVQQTRMTTFTSPTVTPMEGWSGPTGAATYQEWGLGWFQIGSWFGNDGSVPGSDCGVMYEPITGTSIAAADNFQTSAPYVLAALALNWYNIASFLLPGSTDTPGYSPTAASLAKGATIGDGVQGLAFRTLWKNIMNSYTGGNLSAVEAAASAQTAGVGEAYYIQDFYMTYLNSPPNSYYYGKPLIDQGDPRTYVQIGLDYINSFAGGSHPDGTRIPGPPIGGVLHQMQASQRVQVQEGQVIEAGASLQWVNAFIDGPGISVGVNAYDTNDNLIATVTATQATIINPEPSSNWKFVPVSAAFVMPEGAATACLVVSVEPDVMTTGSVWFTDADFAPTQIIDAALLTNMDNVPQLAAINVGGPQGEADLATAFQNLIDGLAAASTNTNVTGVQLANMLQAAGVTANNAASALALGVANNQIITNISSQPAWSGLQPTGQATFPLAAFTGSSLPFVNILSGHSLIGWINSSQVTTVGFVEFLASGTSPTGIFVNLYTVDPLTGNMTNVYTSDDVSTSITSSLNWVAITIPDDDQFQITVGTMLAVEIVASGSSINVVAQTVAVPNNPNSIPPNVGAARVLASTGGDSPSTLTPSQVSYGGIVPWACLSVTVLPNIYQQPVTANFTTAGLFNVSLPTWIQTGDFVDLITLPGGGSGGWADGNFWTVNPGQGGAAGEWAADTLVYGVDIPDSVTQLVVAVGDGGSAPSGSGCNSLIGYGTLAAPVLDHVSLGASALGTTMQWQHTATAGALVLVGLNTDFGTFSVTYGGVTMTEVGLVYNGDAGSGGATTVFALYNAPAGLSTIVVTLGVATYMSAGSISYLNVSSVATVQNVFGSGTALTQSVMLASKQLAVQFFGTHGAEMGSFTGGTLRSYNYYPSGGAYYSGLAIVDSAASTTFGATNNLSDAWGGVQLVLNPFIPHILQSTTGGAAGGVGGAGNYNPQNLVTNNVGASPGNQQWNGILYQGGQAVSGSVAGNVPGGGSGGSVSAAPTLRGARGVATVVTRQAVGHGGTGIGGIGGGGAELPVAFEAVGTGSDSSTQGTTFLTWTHNSGGGSTSAVILLGAVDFQSGNLNIVASYGGYSFTVTLDIIQYYNSGGIGIGLFAVGMMGVPSGPQTVELSFSGSATINDIAGNTVSYQDVGSFGNASVASGSSASPAISVVGGNADQIVVAGFSGLSAAFSGFTQTQRWNQTDTASVPMIVGDAVGASSVAFGASSTAGPWGAVYAILNPIGS